LKRALLAVLVGASSLLAATNFPFPQFNAYPFGIKAGGKLDDPKAVIQEKYEDWLSKYYGDCGDGRRARIKWVDIEKGNAEGTLTVSEGIGYGMLILVYMDNATNNTRAKFDKLWNYYNSFLDGNGLMKWKINGCNNALDDGAATDAEMDVALALIMASKQWGDDPYKADALALLKKIWDKEVDHGNKLLKPGDLWADPYNPSYFATGALRVFAQFDTDATHKWNDVADACLNLIEKNAHPTTGLNSDWCSSGGNSVDKNGSGTGKFGYDAVRTPWRFTLDYLWFGTAKAKTQAAKITSWIRNTTSSFPSRIRMEYSQDGTPSQANPNVLYMGALVIPGMVDAANKTWVDNGEMEIASTSGAENYYGASWQLLYQLTLAGNLLNPMKPSGVIGLDGRRIPLSWKAGVHQNTIRVELDAPGVVDLVDASGRMLGSARGGEILELEVPARKGIYFVVAQTATERAVMPVVGN